MGPLKKGINKKNIEKEKLNQTNGLINFVYQKEQDEEKTYSC